MARILLNIPGKLGIENSMIPQNELEYKNT